MVTTLTGDNTFGWQQALRQLVAAFVAEYGDLAVERLDGEETDFSRLQTALTGLPFLANKKLVVLRTPGANKQFVETAEKLLQNLPETTDAVLVEPKLDKRLSYYKFLRKSTEFKEFPELDVAELAQWLVQAAKAQNGNLSLGDARYLVERVGPGQQLLSNELEKLLTHDPKITHETINVLTEPTPQSTIFQLLEAAFAGQSKRALNLYAEQRALKVEPQQIIAMLTWQLHILAVIKVAGDRTPDQIAKEAKLSPFVVRKSATIARNISIGDLKQLIVRLKNIDLKSKRTALDLDDALQHYLLSLG